MYVVLFKLTNKLGSDFLRTTIRSYNGMVLVDIRKFYKDSNSGEMRPGSKGKQILF